MIDRTVSVSIRCPRCLTWSMDNADFCHICGHGLRPWPEEALFRRSQEILAESAEIIGKLSRNMEIAESLEEDSC